MDALAQLLEWTPGARLVGEAAGVGVRHVRYDSRRVGPGDLFVAVPGLREDGARYIQDAVARGAATIVAEIAPSQPVAVPLVLVPDARAALADLAAARLDHPAQSMCLIGVTGTDGKTTVSRLIAEIMERAGNRVGWITTVDLRIGDRVRKNPFGHTTPPAPELQETLAEMRDAGVQIAVVEASSHALALDRLRACRFAAAVFTNLANEHLNFHGTTEHYREAKGRLFRAPGLRFAVLNADDPASNYFAQITRAQVHTYGLSEASDLRACEVEASASGCRFTAVWRGADEGIRTPLVTRFAGRFNILNWLAACLTSRLLGASFEVMEQTAREALPPPGRMQQVDVGQPFRVVVDFSHTPQALANALRELRPYTSGRLMAVFGHAGERDPDNRPAMGEVAARYADYFVVTTDDPEYEEPTEIARRVAAGATALGREEGRDFAVVLDRRCAFEHLFRRAQPGDCILLAGRGHEDAMPVRGEDLPFNDAGVAIDLLREQGY